MLPEAGVKVGAGDVIIVRTGRWARRDAKGPWPIQGEGLAGLHMSCARWLHARDDLIDIERYRVRLQNYFPVARFGASFYVRTRDRFAMREGGLEVQSTPIDEIS